MAFSSKLLFTVAEELCIFMQLFTLIIQHRHKAPAKRSQHANAAYRNIVGRNMLRAFGHRVVTCYDMLGVVGSNWTIFKPEPTTPNMSHTVAKRTQHVAPNSVSICCVDMLRSFGRGLRLLLRLVGKFIL